MGLLCCAILFRKKYECVMKELSLIRIDRDRLLARTVEDSPKVISSILSKDPIEVHREFTPWPCTSVHLAFPSYFSPLSISSKFESSHAISRIAVCNDQIATGSDDGSVRFLSLTDNVLISDSVMVTPETCFVAGLAFHPSNPIVYVTSGSGQILMAKEGSWSSIDERVCVWSIAVHPDGGYAATGSMDQSVKLIDLNLFQTRTCLRGHCDSVNSVAWFGHSVLSASADKTLGVFDPRTRRMSQRVAGHRASVNAVAVQGPTTFASADSDGIVMHWDVRRLTEPVVAVAMGSCVNSIAPFADETLALSCHDGFVRILNGSSIVETISFGNLEVLDCVAHNVRLFVSDSSGALTLLEHAEDPVH